MAYIESAEAKKELGRIDEILESNHLLIGGLAVKHFYPARESKDIDLVCSDKVRNKIIRELYPSDEWDIADENLDEYRPDYDIKNKTNDLCISFGPKIEEREPYANIKWEFLLEKHSIPFGYGKREFKNIHIPTAEALAYTKLISFINRCNDKDSQDLQDFVDLTNHKSCSLDVLFNLINRVVSVEKLQTDFWGKIHSKVEYQNIIKKGNIFKLAAFFHGNNISHLTNDSPCISKTNSQNEVENNPIFFSQGNRHPKANIPKVIENAKEFYFMARTGMTFFTNHKSAIFRAIDNNCKCKFLIVNKHSQAIEYGQLTPSIDKANALVTFNWLQAIKDYDGGRNNVEIRVLNNFPPFCFEYFKKSNDQKIINIRPIFFTNHNPDIRPIFMLEEDCKWHEVFYSEFDQLWGKAQVWGKTGGSGKPKRIIFDGCPGAGKTTLLTGKSQRDIYNREFRGLNASGYSVFTDLVNASLKEMRERCGNMTIQPTDDWKLFFECATDRAIKYYEAAKPDLISFYDRGIFYLEIMAEKNNCIDQLPDRYYSFIQNYRYDDPVFIVHPIYGIEIKPQEGDSKTRVFTDEERKKQHEKIIALYKRYKYKIVYLPAPTHPDALNNNDMIRENVHSRLGIVNEKLGI